MTAGSITRRVHASQYVSGTLYRSKMSLQRVAAGSGPGRPQAAGRQRTRHEVQDAWAAGLWVRLFNAKKNASDGGGSQLDRLAGEIGDQLALAAIQD